LDQKSSFYSSNPNEKIKLVMTRKTFEKMKKIQKISYDFDINEGTFEIIKIKEKDKLFCAINRVNFRKRIRFR
jgi:hypothetical protein